MSTTSTLFSKMVHKGREEGVGSTLNNPMIHEPTYEVFCFATLADFNPKKFRPLCKKHNFSKTGKQQISVYISDPPEIEVDQSWVPTGEGIEAEVSCNIHAEPPADVSVMA